MKNLLLLTGLLLLTCASFFFSPPPTGPADEYWGSYARLNGSMGFVINGDSREYLAAAKEPARLLRDKEVRQSRPLYVLLAAGLGYALQPVLGGIPVGASWGGIAAETPDFLPFYAAYVLLNLGLLLAALVLWIRSYALLVPGQGDVVVPYALGFFLLSNPITKAFFWTAHQQMFTFLTPLLALYGLLRYRGMDLRPGPGTAVALALGVLPLVYGNLVLLLPCLLYQLLRYRAGRSAAVVAGQLLLAVGAFMLPTLLWIGLLKLRGVTYYNHEAVRFHQLVWMLEAGRESGTALWAAGSANLLAFVLNLRALGFFLAAAGLAALLPRQRAAAPGAWTVVRFLFGLFFGFYALLGYYPERLTFTLLPLVLAALALLLYQRPLPYQRLALVLAALGWHLYQVGSYGPFS